MTRQNYLATAEKSLTLFWVWKICCREQMHMPKCLKNTIFFHLVIMVWTFYSVILEESRFSSMKEHMRTKWLWRQHLRKTGSMMNHMSALCAHAGFYSLAWRKTTCSNIATSQEIYNYYLHSSWVFATLQNFIWCFRKHVMLCSSYVLHGRKRQNYL